MPQNQHLLRKGTPSTAGEDAEVQPLWRRVYRALEKQSYRRTQQFRSLVAQWLKHLPAMRETRVRSLGRKDPLEKEMATHSSTLAWGIPWTEEPGGLQSTGSQKVRHD